MELAKKIQRKALDNSRVFAGGLNIEASLKNENLSMKYLLELKEPF